MVDGKQRSDRKPAPGAVAKVDDKPAEAEAYAEIAEKGAKKVRALIDAVKDGVRRDQPAHER